MRIANVLSLALVTIGLALPGICLATNLTITAVTLERSSKEVTLSGSGSSQTFSFDNEADPAAIAAIASASGAVWNDTASDDTLILDYAVTSSSGVLPPLGSTSTLVWSGPTLSMNAASRTLDSTTKAADFGAAVAAARSLAGSLGATLSESTGHVVLTIPLE